MSVLEIRGLHVSVDTENGSVEILKGVDLTIKSGETHAIMGPTDLVNQLLPTQLQVTLSTQLQVER